MITDQSITQQFKVVKFSFRWTLLVFPMAVTVGSVIALFLTLLNWAIHFRFQHSWLLFLLPVAGLAIHFIYRSIGRSSERGNNLIMEEIHQPGAGIPFMMTPVILFSTVVTHLFGGSAGREGTAVQIGGSIASRCGKIFKLGENETKLMLTAGIAAGFGAVFGTPLTGAIFAMEVLAIGSMRYQALLPALVASVLGDLTVTLWGIHHHLYHIDPRTQSSYFPIYQLTEHSVLLGKVIFASVCFGMASKLFSTLIEKLKALFSKFITIKWIVPALGGLIVIGLTHVTGKPDYLSLGVDNEYPGAITISSAFQAGGADTWSWLWKTGYTALTLASGFKGGEVTPLFYIGATLGNTLAVLLNAPVSLFAALGFIAVFSGATNTPIACTIMGAELFGSEYLLFFAVACITAYLFSGRSGIYSAQKTAIPKFHFPT